MNILRFPRLRSPHFRLPVCKLPLLLVALSALGAATAQAAQLASAKALNITGSVAKYDASGDDRPLKQGEILTEGDGVTTGAVSSVELVFSNGSRLQVEQNSSLTFSEMEQEAYSGNQSYEQLNADPSRSLNRLTLNYGRVTGNVKQLQSGSDFVVETPLGAALVRGTTFTVDFRYNAVRNEMVLTIQNEDGLVDVVSQYVGRIDYGRGNTANKGFTSESDQQTREPIPPRHTVIIRMSSDDPLYDNVVDMIENYTPAQVNGEGPVVVPLPGSGEDDDNQPEFTPDDPGVIIISPEGPAVD